MIDAMTTDDLVRLAPPAWKRLSWRLTLHSIRSLPEVTS